MTSETIEVYWSSGSPFSWRVLLALEVKQLEYQSRRLSQDDKQTPDFRRLNPRGQVPLVRVGADIVTESLAIIAFLDQKYPRPPLFGRTPTEAGRVWQLACEAISYLDAPVETVIAALYFGRAVERRDAVSQALQTCSRELTSLEERLASSGGQWLACDVPSAADCVIYPMVASLLRASAKNDSDLFDWTFLPDGTLQPRISRWMARMEALPGFERAYPPHWRQTEMPYCTKQH